MFPFPVPHSPEEGFYPHNQIKSNCQKGKEDQTQLFSNHGDLCYTIVHWPSALPRLPEQGHSSQKPFTETSYFSASQQNMYIAILRSRLGIVRGNLANKVYRSGQWLFRRDLTKISILLY